MLDNKNFFSEDVTRREFIKQGILGLMGTGIALSGLDMLFGKDVFAAFDADPAEKIGRMYFRKLGKTGLKISEIGMNGGILKDPSVLSFAMDAGLNYIETGPEYSQGEAERTLGKVLKLRREEIIVATKWKVFEEYRVKELETSLNDSLKRLNTDYIDIIQVWGTRRKTQVNHEPIFEAFQKLKEQGKVRHLGITVHMNVVELCDEIIANGQYEQMTVAYH
ncbi:aldo/keto reductase, partial [bacterium]|nr:aldo/keto reductase [bacterium]